MRIKTEVFYWKYNDGWRDIPLVLQARYKATREFDAELIGWHCWVYPVDDKKFEKWMKKNMKGKYDCTSRFNSGDPMYTVLICDDEDATLFKLTWM